MLVAGTDPAFMPVSSHGLYRVCGLDYYHHGSEYSSLAVTNTEWRQQHTRLQLDGPMAVPSASGSTGWTRRNGLT